MSTLYKHADDHQNWIVEYEGQWYRVPGEANGWANRRQLPGRPPGERLTIVPRHYRMGLGLPDPNGNPTVEQVYEVD